MSSQAAANIPHSVAAPAESIPAQASPAQDTNNDPAAFGANMLNKKDAQQDPSADTQNSSSETDAAAVAAAAAAAAAADASSAAQTITQLATAATNAAAAAPNGTAADPTASASASASASDAPAAAVAADSADAAASAAAADKPDESAAAQPTADDAQADDPKPAGQEAPQESVSGLPRNVESELRDIYSVSSAIANFCVAHVNQVNVPTPQKVRTVIQKALKLTSSLSMLLAQPEVALRQLDANDDNKRPAESKLDSARKRQRSSDWDAANRTTGSPSAPGLPMAPFTPNSGLRVFPDGSLPTSFPSPGFDEGKGPQYKKRSRAPAPGSCQACGTSETPEWRRGPDGARTLCNACGLHYAKLVRKRMQQEGGDEASPSQPPPQVALVSLEELRASTKSAEAAAAAGITPSASSNSLNGTPMKGDRSAWNTPSKPPRVPSALANTVMANNLEAEPQPQSEQQHEAGEAGGEQLPPPPAPAPVSVQPAQGGAVEPAPTPVSSAPVHDSVIAPELAAEGAHPPMDTSQ